MGSAKRDVTFPRYADCSRRKRRIAQIMRKLILAGFILSQPTLSNAEEQSFTDVSFRMKPICEIFAPTPSNDGLPKNGRLDVFVVLDIASTYRKGQKYTVKTKELFSIECFSGVEECRAFRMVLSDSTWEKNRATGSHPVGFDRMVLRNIKVASSTSKFATVIWDGTTTLTVDAHLGKVTLRASFPPERGSQESIGEGRCVVR
jgi:hypothetical protein